MDLGFDVVVTFTGIVLVFLILVLLMAIITLEGKIFDGLGKKKAAAKAVADRAKTDAAETSTAAAFLKKSFNIINSPPIMLMFSIMCIN